MRICKIWDADYPWDVRVEKVCEALIAAGHEVHLVCRNRQQKPEYEQLGELHIHRLPKWSGGSKGFLGFPFFLNPLWLREILRVVADHAIDVILVRDLPMALAGVLVGKTKNIPCTLDMAEPYPEMLQGYCELQRVSLRKRFVNSIVRNQKFAEFVERIACKYLDHIFSVSPEIRENLIKKGANANKISLLLNTPVLAKSWQINTDGPVFPAPDDDEVLKVAYVGDLTEARGVPFALSAIKKLVDAQEPFKLVVIGRGRYETAIREAVRANQIESSVEFTGFVAHDKLVDELRKSHIGIIPHIPTLHNNLTLPNKVFDYMAVGLPVVTADLVPIAKVVEDARAGVVYKSGDVDSLVSALRRLKDRNLRLKMGDNGKNAVIEKYNWAEDFKGLETTLQRICHNQADPLRGNAGATLTKE